MPKIAVITPYFKEPLEFLEQCHASVRAQAADVTHFMVADGFPRAELATWNVRHVTLPSAHADGGATARGIGGILADVEGYDFIAYLDADNWYEPHHLASLLELYRSTGAPVCTSFRTFRGPDGRLLPVNEPSEDVGTHVDTSCYLIHRRAFGVLPIWGQTPGPLGPLCDRVFLAGIRHQRLMMASTQQRTVAYRTLYETHYTSAGLVPPPGFKPKAILDPAMAWLQTKEGVDTCFHRLGFWPLTYL